MSLFLGVGEAVLYCDIHGYDSKYMEVTRNQFYALLVDDTTDAPRPHLVSTDEMQIFGVTIMARKYPRWNTMRTRYLMAIQDPAWIQSLLWSME